MRFLDRDRQFLMAIGALICLGYAIYSLVAWLWGLWQ